MKVFIQIVLLGLVLITTHSIANDIDISFHNQILALF